MHGKGKGSDVIQNGRRGHDLAAPFGALHRRQWFLRPLLKHRLRQRHQAAAAEAAVCSAGDGCRHRGVGVHQDAGNFVYVRLIVTSADPFNLIRTDIYVA
ncbi:unnamed protein product [Cuscuta epithymum]|uniref:Uncharacterized protein n=1 Tax=Cuscuta epithymum TaxID=186058 RepID=A0AAV0EWP2_9ASTE|nr:unnamed protein product [Cuscuta epithymum]